MRVSLLPWYSLRKLDAEMARQAVCVAGSSASIAIAIAGGKDNPARQVAFAPEIKRRSRPCLTFNVTE